MSIRSTLPMIVGFSALMSAHSAFAEMETIPLTQDNWVLIAGASITEKDGRNAIEIGNSEAVFGMAVLKRAPFENGVIEYDLQFGDTRTFTGLQFRIAGQGEAENFYMRGHHSGQADSNQYMTNYNGIPSWQLYHGEANTAPTVYPKNEWFHVKYVIQDGLLDIYINDQSKPELTVALKRDQTAGGIGLWGLDFGGPSWISNFAVDAVSDEKIVGTPAPEAIAEAGTVMTWQVSSAVDHAELEKSADLPDAVMAAVTFTEMTVEATGMLNLAKLQGVAEGADTALAKITITSETDQMKAFEFGFSDDVTVYLNGMPIFSGSDRFLSRDYRFLGTVGYNDTAWLSLKSGENTLILAITEDVVDTTGWGVQGRFLNMDGISVK